MKQSGYSLLFWVAIGMALFSSFLGMTIVPTIWMMIAAIYLVGGDIVKELRNGKCKEGESNKEPTVVETS